MSQEPSLADLCQDFFMLAVQVDAGKLQLPDCRSLQEAVLGMFETLKREAQQANKAPIDIDDCTYALVAFIDEVVQGSQWHDAQNWRLNPLQMVMFGENVAGENFYHRLRQVRQRSTEAAEVYFICMVLGFQGVYGLPSRRHQSTEREELIEDLRRELGRGAKKRLAPRGLPRDRGDGQRRSFPMVPAAVLSIVLSVLVGAALFIVLAVLRSNTVDRIMAIGG